MYLEGVINGAGVLVLLDSGSTHNVIDINVARSISL
jgi:predicted aspartyl protease